MPRRANTKPIFADVLIMRMSIGNVIVIPTPTAGPLIAAMTGLRLLKMRSETRPPPSRGTPTDVCTSLPPRPNVSPPPERSAPAQNPRPRPVTITTRTSSSASERSNASMISRIIVDGERVELVRSVERQGRDPVGNVIGDLRVPHSRHARHRTRPRPALRYRRVHPTINHPLIVSVNIAAAIKRPRIARRRRPSRLRLPSHR